MSVFVSIAHITHAQRDADGEHLFMPESKANVEVLGMAGGELNNALTNPFFGKL